MRNAGIRFHVRLCSLACLVVHLLLLYIHIHTGKKIFIVLVCFDSARIRILAWAVIAQSVFIRHA